MILIYYSTTLYNSDYSSVYREDTLHLYSDSTQYFSIYSDNSPTTALLRQQMDYSSTQTEYSPSQTEDRQTQLDTLSSSCLPDWLTAYLDWYLHLAMQHSKTSWHWMHPTKQNFLKCTKANMSKCIMKEKKLLYISVFKINGVSLYNNSHSLWYSSPARLDPKNIYINTASLAK